MAERKIDAIIVDGFGPYDTNFFYLTRVHHLTGIFVKKQNEKGILIHGIMERDEAKKTGLDLIEMSKYEYNKIVEKERDRIKAWAKLLGKIIGDLGIKGRVCLYGNKSVGSSYFLVKFLLRAIKEIKIVHEPVKTILQEARETKDTEEVRRIREVAAKTEEAVGDLINFIKQHKVQNGRLIKADCQYLKIRDLKRFLSKALLERGLIEVTGTILSIGRDAGIPHSVGNLEDEIEMGKTVIVDVFPREIGGGYFYDFTRTFVLGSASQEIVDAYNLVAEAQTMLIKSFAPGKKTRNYELKLCKFFEKYGHPTPLNSPNTKVGYIHSLGHGLGLDVHERPVFGLARTNRDTIQPGSVFTVEPGLYYPEKGFGIRLEDVVYISPQGEVENLSKFPKKLIIEI